MGLKKYFQRIIPPRHEIQGHRNLQFLGEILHDPNLFHLNRYSSAGGVANGLFFAFFPVPGQTIIAAIVAVVLRVNLPLTVVFLWLTNPLTFAPIFYFCYKVGARLMGASVQPLEFQLSVAWISERIGDIWAPLFLGSFVVGSIASLTGYSIVRLLWRLAVVRKWEERKIAKFNNKKQNDKTGMD